jgi:hypothetical protein
MDSYTHDELRLLSHCTRPQRGPFCEKCGNHIPEFADVSPSEQLRLRRLAERNVTEAMQELMRLTGCSKGWAKIWVAHPDGPQPKHLHRGTPCPYCGAPLRTNKARQCMACGMDWHGEKPVCRKKDKP